MFTMMVGEIDSVPGTASDLQAHKISTRFLAFIGPFIPFETLCVTSESFEHLGGRTTRHSWAGEKVRLNLWSIVLGYLRVWLGIGIFALPFVLFWGQSVHAAQFVPSGYALLALIVVMVVPGLLTRTRRKKLTVLRRVIGLGCDPSFRDGWRRGETTEGLMARLGELRLPSSPDTLVDRLSSLDQPARELVFATAWYQSVGNSAWKPLREAAWAKLAGA